MSLFRKLRRKDEKAPASAPAAPALSNPAFPDGIKQLHPPSGTEMEDAEVDICFVHGLTGDREKTWTAEGQPAPWPQMLLPSIFPKARILTFGYDAYVVQAGVASSNGLDNHAKNLLNDIVGDRQDCHAKSRPLIFVAHSLGGIVCKQAISFSRSSKFEHLHDVYDSVIGIAFMGTPHRGSSLAKWADIPVTTLGVFKSVNSKLTDVLHIENPLLVRTYNEFLDALADRQNHGKAINIVCFYEELPIFKNLKVVTEHSATMDGDIAISIHANHMDMVRFTSKDGNDFRRLRRELARWIDDSQTANSAMLVKANEANTAGDPMDTVCIQDLCLTDPDDDRTRIEKKNGTFFENIHDWVFSNDAYKQWKDGDPESRLLWIRGDPGKGKTMIMCSMIRALKDSGTPLSYFFCQATNDKLNHATAVLRGLIYVFVRRQPALVSHVRKEYDHKGKRLFEGVNAWEALSKIFIDMINDERLAEAVVLVDGLDECTEGRSQLLELIAQPSHIRWLVSSRNWPDIQEGFRGAEQKTELRLELNPDAIARAVDAYVRLKVNQLTGKKRLEKETRDAVEKHLLANADGTFLWVALVCHALEGVRPWHVRDELTSFPHGLSALYGRMMQMIQDVDDEDDAENCRGILAVASTVYRPITLAELRVLWPSLANHGINHLEDTIQLCGSFLTLRDDTLYFVHQSAKDYLVGEAQPKIFPRGIPDQHHAIASRSLAAMSNVLRRDMYGLRHPGYAIEDVKPPADDPLAPIAYSCIFWVDHLAEAETTQRDISLHDGNEVHRFFLEKYLYWLEALVLLKNVWAGALAVRKLNTMVNGKKQDLADFLYDSRWFISSCAHIIAMWPLQTYASALYFSPENSKVRRQFAKEEPKWVTIKHEVPPNLDAFEQKFEGDTSLISSVAFSPDGQTLASGSTDETVKVWDSASGQCTRTFSGHDDVVISVAFSPDGQKLASGAIYGAVKVWYVASGQCAYTLKGHTNRVASVAFSPDGQILASGSDDQNVKIWNVASGQCAYTLRGHTSYVASVAFSPDGQILASGSGDQNVKIWSMVSGQCTHTFNHPGQITSVAFSTDGQELLSASGGGTVKVWSVVSGQCKRTLKKEHDGNLHLKAMSPDGQRQAGVTNNTVHVWDLTGKFTRSLFIHGDPYTIEFSPEGQYLAIAYKDINIWNLATEQPSQTNDNDFGYIYSLNYSPTGQYLATGHEKGIVKIFDMATVHVVQILQGKDERITAIAFSQDRQYLATGDDGGTVQIFCLETGDVTQTIKSSSYIRAIAFSPDRQYLATGNTRGTVQILKVKTGDVIQSISGVFRDFTSISFSPDGRYLATNWRELVPGGRLHDTVVILDLATGLPIQTPTGSATSSISSWVDDFFRTPVYGLSEDMLWITAHGRNLLRLPMEYQPHKFAWHEEVAVISTRGGRVFALHFPPGYSADGESP